jgi:hypothetical protein
MTTVAELRVATIARFAAAVVLLALMLCWSRTGAVAADFGNPPSGEIPILFNDRTVYASPDLLKQQRVLAALVKGGHIFIPLRSMFEELGATVSASGDGKTVSAVKTGVTVSVTVGKPEVVINGEARPLDVPPIVYHGIVLVPVRVLSEALGAYVQWVPEKHVVVVRYIAAPVPTAPPTPVPTAPPTPTPTVRPTLAPTPPPTAAPTLPPPLPTPAPTAVPAERSYTVFATAAWSGSTNYNELVAGGYCDTYVLSAAYAPKNSPFAVKADFRQDAYVTTNSLTDAFGNHYTQFATIDGGTAFTPVFLARQNTFDARLEYQVAAPRIYVGVGYLHSTNNYGAPSLNGIGVGVEKLPDLRPGVGLYGSAFYYPSATGTFTVSNTASPNNGATYRQQYGIVKYDIGVALAFAHSPVFLNAGFSGDQYTARQSAPVGQLHIGPYIGLGAKI